MTYQTYGFVTYQNPEHAFANAIRTGRLSDNPKDENYAGKYMYMGTNENDADFFKHIDTRKYLPLNKTK